MNEQLRAFMTLLCESGMSLNEVIREGYVFAKLLAFDEADQAQRYPINEIDVMRKAANALRDVSVAFLSQARERNSKRSEH